MDFLVDTSILEIITFIFFAFMVWNRNVDAAGVTQTTELKLVNLVVLDLLFNSIYSANSMVNR